jgi:hypothetical protein
MLCHARRMTTDLALYCRREEEDVYVKPGPLQRVCRMGDRERIDRMWLFRIETAWHCVYVFEFFLSVVTEATPS